MHSGLFRRALLSFCVCAAFAATLAPASAAFQVQTLYATNITKYSAFFCGKLTGQLPRSAKAWFQYGQTPAYGSRTFEVPLLPTAYQEVRSRTDTLIPGTTYHFRLTLVDLLTMTYTYGSDMTFTTLPDAPGIKNSRLDTVGSTSAVLKAYVEPNGADTTVYAQYGPAPEYLWETARLSCGTTRQEVALDLTGLLPGTSYQCRVIAANQLGTVTGTELFFTTIIVPPKLRPIGFSPPGVFPKGFWLSLETAGPGNYQIETSANGMQWDYLGVLYDPDPIYDFVDQEAPPLGTRFYRAILLRP